MEFLKFILVIIVSQIIYYPIEKKFGLRKKYKNKENKTLRAIFVLLGIIDILLLLLLGVFFQESLDNVFIEIMLITPLLFVLMVGSPFTNN